MALTDFQEYLDSFKATPQPIHYGVGATTTTVGRLSDCWATTVPAGTAPTTSAVPTNATQGGLQQEDGGSGNLYLIASQINMTAPGVIIWADRLVHQGGLSGTGVGAQTTNLPTSALTRYTSGVGVMIGLTIYSQIGTTSTTVTASYTNENGTAGQTTPLVLWGATGFREANRMVLLPLAAGDTGVRAVASVTAAASTGTIGNFGVTLFKPLFMTINSDIGNSQVQTYVDGGTLGGIPELIDDTCLFPIVISSTTAGANTGTIYISEV